MTLDMNINWWKHKEDSNYLKDGVYTNLINTKKGVWQTETQMNFHLEINGSEHFARCKHELGSHCLSMSMMSMYKHTQMTEMKIKEKIPIQETVFLLAQHITKWKQQPTYKTWQQWIKLAFSKID